MDNRDGTDIGILKGERTNVGYWESLWNRRRKVTPFHLEIRKRSLRLFAYRQFHDLFSKVLKGRRGKRLIEIGCAGSVWLPYFASLFEMEVTGIDYSPSGCAQSRELLESLNITGQVIQADLFSPPPQLQGSFDVVVSFGVIEHFSDPCVCIRACSKFLKKSGLMISVIPNMRGMIGKLQKCVDPAVYNAHVPLSREELQDAHESAGLGVLLCDYFLFINFGVINMEMWKRRHPVSGRAAGEVARGVTGMIWAVESLIPFRLRGNRYTSPNIVCVAQSK